MVIKGITEEDLVKLGSLEEPVSRFNSDIKAISQNLEAKLSELSNGLITSLDNENILRVIYPILLRDNTGGFGYVSSSFGFSRDFELLWTAIIAKAFYDRNYIPLVIPIDKFYSYRPVTLSFVYKTEIFSEHQASHKSEKPYALIIAGFTESETFTYRTLSDIPRQGEIFRDPEDIEIKVDRFARNKLHMLFSDNGSLEKVLQETVIGDLNDYKLLLCTGLLLQDCQTWQNLWYQSKKGEGVPLFIVAPSEFHEAMNRLNECWGHGARDYHYRASCALGASDYPPFSIVNSKLKTYDDCIKESLSDDYKYNTGLNREKFRKRIGYILEAIA